ncbi:MULTISPECIES: tryptophan synthase subunit alpha [unclassified Haladaptatus]|uniref:tryptophan synthase subunit alpha n=1 Tax=unclassified Haladaptatus TaxID=2622732 RepID=UPI00209C11E2|nr:MULTISPECIES: tryptophan synthase subunit alpha [unclassified Haladaptatus]MCO8244492.1 tryptophan synthase subunit alpha [Haladaptatus sp. AB643]MCO8253886.1 tryptophan synthase subunit alpha [Haladaptatus sp. AB618]
MSHSKSDLESAFADEPALIPYVVAGDPGIEETKEYVRALVRGGADVIELGLPFSEPIADGPTIQNAIQRALDGGMTPQKYLGLVSELDVDVPIVCMTYYNLIYQYGSEEGVEAFVSAAADAGIAGLIVPDLPVEESGPLRLACDEYGLDLVFIVAPTTTDRRKRRISTQASGFVYVQARMGTTGAQADVSGDTHESLQRLAGSDLPKAVGFGVSEGEHAREIVSAGADGVVVGSALVDIVASGEDVAERLETKAAELKSGAREGRQDIPEPERTSN